MKITNRVLLILALAILCVLTQALNCSVDEGSPHDFAYDQSVTVISVI
jgi:hypothetical protein